MASPALHLLGYCRVAEAALLLILARTLVAFVPMRFWRKSLGTLVSEREPAGMSPPPPAVYALVTAVQRACLRLPITMRCLPRAMALHWMARRRGIRLTLHIGIQRGVGGGLHAWVDCQGTTIIGQFDGPPYSSVLAFNSAPPLNDDQSPQTERMMEHEPAELTWEVPELTDLGDANDVEKAMAFAIDMYDPSS